jgi:hypothetical protein
MVKVAGASEMVWLPFFAPLPPPPVFLLLLLEWTGTPGSPIESLAEAAAKYLWDFISVDSVKILTDLLGINEDIRLCIFNRPQLTIGPLSRAP